MALGPSGGPMRMNALEAARGIVVQKVLYVHVKPPAWVRADVTRVGSLEPALLALMRATHY